MTRKLNIGKGDFITLHAPLRVVVTDISVDGKVITVKPALESRAYGLSELRRHHSGALVFTGTMAIVDGLRRGKSKSK
jgi:hypothetical protein